MMPWYVTALLTIGSLIAGHLWGIIASASEINSSYERGYDNGLAQGQEIERELRNQSLQGFWRRR